MTDQPHLARVRGERGATATEYGVLVGFVAIALVAGVLVFGESLSDYFGWLAEQITEAWTADDA